jgi:hypothetical protein
MNEESRTSTELTGSFPFRSGNSDGSAKRAL